MLDKPEVTLTVRLPEHLSNRLNQTARDLDQTRGELIRRALDRYLDQAPVQPVRAGDTDHVIQ